MWNVLTGMVFSIGQLRGAEIIRARFIAFVNRRIQVDEMGTFCACRTHDDIDMPLRIKP